MLQQVTARIGIAVLAVGMVAGPARAQHHSGGGHGVAPHPTFVRPNNHFNGGHGVAPHPAFVRPNNHFDGGHAFHNPGFNPFDARRPFFWPGFGVGFGVPFYSGFGYPYDSGFGYADYGSEYGPDYGGPDVIAPQPDIAAYPPAETAPMPGANGSARMTVQLPADAQLWIDGQPTSQTGSVRSFETPVVLDPGREYSYHLKAQWVANGQPVTRERKVTFHAGNQAMVNLNVP